MEGYVWLYRGKELKHCNVTGKYEDFKREGWSAYPDGRDIKPQLLEGSIARPEERPKRAYNRRKNGE